MAPFQIDKILFYFTIITGIFIAISSPSWFVAWLGLELNLLSFVPLIFSEKNSYSSERALKYFLVQAIGSIAILIGRTILYLTRNPQIEKIIICALLFKIGAAPVHFWLPRVMQGLSWTNCALLITAQKITPIALLLNTDKLTRQELIFGASILCGILGGIGGLNQTLLRKILAYSSISHIGWLLAIVRHDRTRWAIYLILYAYTVLSIVSVLDSSQIFHNYHFTTLVCGPIPALGIFLSLFSIGGLPPLLGFIAKIIVINELLTQRLFFWILILIIRSLITLYFYTRLFLRTISLNKPELGSTLMKTNLTVGLLTLFTWSIFIAPFYLY